MGDKPHSETGMTIARIQTLTDSLFAIAMTFLVLAFKHPKKELNLTASALHKFLWAQFPELYSYVLSFILLALFWLVHHWHFRHLRKTDNVHLWINIFFLLFVALVPYTTSLSGLFYSDWLVQFYFCFNILVISLLIAVNWTYATHNMKLVRLDLDKEVIQHIHQKNIATLLICILATLVAFLWATFSTFIFLLIPISTIYYSRQRKKNNKN